MGLLIHAKTRKKSLVEKMASLGFSISYNRVLEIHDRIIKQLCKKHDNEAIVCQPSLKKGLFTWAAIDNLDHNPSSSTADTAFHGTSISVFQHNGEYPEQSFQLKSKESIDITTDIVPERVVNQNQYNLI